MAEAYSAVSKHKTGRAIKRNPGSAIRTVIAQSGGKRDLRAKVTKIMAKRKPASTSFNDQVVTCLLCPGSLNTDGYQQVNIRAASKVNKDIKQQTAYLHHLVHWVATDKIISSWSDSISHLCHHPDCVNEEHLTLEPLWKNIRRQKCQGGSECECDPVSKCVLPGLSQDELEL